LRCTAGSESGEKASQHGQFGDVDRGPAPDTHSDSGTAATPVPDSESEIQRETRAAPEKVDRGTADTAWSSTVAKHGSGHDRSAPALVSVLQRKAREKGN